MSNSQESLRDREKASIALVREAWMKAVKSDDADQLADLMTDDIVAIHADGRCIHGKDDVTRFFQDLFDQFDIEGTISSSEVVIHGNWAVEIDKIETKRTEYESSMSVRASLQAVFLFSRQLDDCWKVSRLVELKGLK